MTKSIIIFSLVSITLHAGLLLVVPSSPHIIEVGAPFRVSIVAAHPQKSARLSTHKTLADNPDQKHPEQQVQKPAATKAVKAVNVASKELASSDKPAPAEPPQEQRQQETPARVEVALEKQTESQQASVAITAQTSSLLRNELQQAFLLKFYYPRLAQKRGWQGEVRLGLKVAASGRLEDIRILQSSGHGLLDRAALDSLGKVKSLPAAIALLNGQEMKLELPVQYRLL